MPCPLAKTTIANEGFDQNMTNQFQKGLISQPNFLMNNIGKTFPFLSEIVTVEAAVDTDSLSTATVSVQKNEIE